MGRIIAKDINVYYPLIGASVAPSSDAEHEPKTTSGWGEIVLGKRPQIAALRNLSLEVKPGSRLGIMGRNGSGKTTLLRTLGGIITPDSGSLEIEGEASGIFNLRQGLKMESSGRRNIMLRGLAIGKTPDQIREKFAAIEEFCGLEEYLDFPVHTYSSGMVMRLSFAVVMAFEPDIMLLDEWIGTADIGFRDRAMARLRSMAENNRVFVLASHSAKLLKDTCDEAIIMDRGEIIDRGPVASVQKAFAKLVKEKG